MKVTSSSFTLRASSPEDRKAISDQEELEALDRQADRIIWKYSLMAGASGLIPAPVAASLIDTPLQLKMFKELTENYQISADPLAIGRSFFAIIDNLIAGKTVGWLIDFLKSIPVIGQTLVPFAKSLWAFGFTCATGWVFKQMLRAQFRGRLSEAPVVATGIITEGWEHALRAIKQHIKDILFGARFVLNRYEVDLEALANDFVGLAEQIDARNNAYSNRHKQIEQDLAALKLTTSDMLEALAEAAEKIGIPSQDGLEAWVNLANLDGVEMRVVMQMIADELRRGELPNDLKNLLLPPSMGGGSASP